MIDQPSPALAEAREIVGKMTPTPWRLKHNSAGDVFIFPGNSVAGVNLYKSANAAGIVRAVALLRTVVAEETVEAVARLIAKAHGYNPDGVTGAIGRKVWEDCVPEARAVLTALLERAREGT